MALRIAGAKMPPQLPPDEELQEPAATDTPEEEAAEPTPDDAQTTKSGTLDPMIAGYKGPEQGPFTCSHCVHYASDGSSTCEIVAGHIDEDGICNVFTPMQHEEEQQAPEEAPPEEMPEEQPTE